MAELELRQGTLELLVLKVLTWGPAHGYTIMGWLKRTTEEELRIEDAALYPALHRMESKGWVAGEWGLSENNRRAKYYRLTARGRRELKAETETWRRYVVVVGRVLSASEQPA